MRTGKAKGARRRKLEKEPHFMQIKIAILRLKYDPHSSSGIP
jgi:hypothetical protein